MENKNKVQKSVGLFELRSQDCYSQFIRLTFRVTAFFRACKSQARFERSLIQELFQVTGDIPTNLMEAAETLVSHPWMEAIWVKETSSSGQLLNDCPAVTLRGEAHRGL